MIGSYFWIVYTKNFLYLKMQILTLLGAIEIDRGSVWLRVLFMPRTYGVLVKG